MKTVLLVEDDPDLVDVLQYALRGQGYSVVTAFDGEQGLQSWATEHPDLVLLDGKLPKVDGFDVCRRIREQAARTPIILLTERSAEAQVLAGFDAGADDYMPKPFSIKQLLARVATVLRRYEGQAERVSLSQLSIGDLTLEPDTHRATRAGQEIALTLTEFQLLYCLALNAGHVVPYSRLGKAAWGYGVDVSSNAIKGHITHLRRKLGLSPTATAPGEIRVVSGIGYRLIGP